MRRRALLSSGKKNYSQDYFTMVVRIGGSVIWSSSRTDYTLSYSKDDGTTWTTVNNGTTISLAKGDKVLWKGTSTTSSHGGIGTFSGKTNWARYSVEGNIMSLLFGDDFKGKTIFEYNNSAFYRLFKGNIDIEDAENLILPVTTLSDSCYCEMFYGCTSLKTAPELPATTLAITCYQNMFYNCKSLNSIKCLATNISATNCTTNWVSGVAASGTFTKAASMSSWTTGASGIPSGWTVQNHV